MARFLPINVSDLTTSLDKKIVPPTGGKLYRNDTKCFNYKIVYDQPGTYSFSMPTTATCAKIVIVGGGGKPLCSTNVCCSWAGAGGGYSEKNFSNPGGGNFSIVVGAQHGSSTVTCNSVVQHTASGAAFCTPGVGTGGDYNSTGGCAGCTMQFQSPSGIGGCVCTALCSICGYCVVIAFKDSGNGGSTCCNTLLSGGGSAGSPFRAQGGNGWSVCGNCWSGVAGGGGGIGQCNCVAYHYSCCNCNCQQVDGNAGGSCIWYVCFPASASGGGGSKMSCTSNYLGNPRSWSGVCTNPVHQGGDGGAGGPYGCDGKATKHWYACRSRLNPSYGSMCGITFPRTQRFMQDPGKVCWWDVCEICGSGAPGYVHENHYVSTTYHSGNWSNRPANSGEGAGTGGVMTLCCTAQMMGFGFPPRTVSTNFINFCLVCYLGTTGQCNLANKVIDKLVPQHLTCAGTLGGSGGMGWCGYDSKAGAGGGGGQVKHAIVCVCHGGVFDCCNQTLNTPLAFPPVCLDTLVSNAGAGLAIIYYRED